MAEQQEQPQLTPVQFLAQFPDAPTQDQIDSLKQQAPGGRIRLFHSSDAKRVYLMRGVTGVELAGLQAKIPQNTDPEKIPGLVQALVAAHCCVWTSATPDHKLNDQVLRGGTAGLPETLHEIVCQLSDYMAPVDIQRFSADL
jgi:hypothetical protein